METICFLLSDKIIFPAFELVFGGLFLFAFLRERGWFVKKSGVIAVVTRGEESWNKFHLAFSGILSVGLMQVINSAEALNGYKTIISISNFGMLVYLAFFNSWFRNKTIGLISKSQQKKEKY